MKPTPLLFALIAASAACGTEGVTESFQTAENNTDVQVLSTRALGSMYFELDNRFDRFACDYDNLEASTFSPPITHTATADCTDMVGKALGAPLINRYVEPGVAIAVEDDGSITYAYFPHSCSEIEVVVAVKKLAYDSDSFRGIGFYAYDQTLNGDVEQRHVFYEKGDPRLVLVGDAKLRREHGEPVLLFRFAGAGVCTYDGSGTAPWGSYIELKPYVSYNTGDGIVDRWEAVESNHRIHYRDAWDRSDDLLDP